MDKTPTDVAKKVLREQNINSLPVDVYELCRKFGISVVPADLGRYEEASGYAISGIIEVDRTGETPEKTIYVNRSDIPERQNFTVAHELGHYFLHLPDDKSDVITSFRGASDKREREADMFAAELLMPTDLVLKEYYAKLYPTVRSLAKTFEVSQAAMRRKLDGLGLHYIG